MLSETSIQYRMKKFLALGRAPVGELLSLGVRTSLSHLQVPGHRSELAFGFLGGNEKPVPVVAMLGRVRHTLYSDDCLFSANVHKFHFYEGHALSTVVYPIRVMARLGVKAVIGEKCYPPPPISRILEL